MTVQSAITAAIPPGAMIETLSRGERFEVAEYREHAVVLLLGPQRSRTPVPWHVWEELGAWLAAKGWAELGAGRGQPTSSESLNGFLDARISRSVGSYVAAILVKAGLAEADGGHPLCIRWMAASGRTRAARSGADAWAQIQAICRDAMSTGRTIATIDRGVPSRILGVQSNAIVRASGGARTPDGQGSRVTQAMVERVWHALASGGHASHIPGKLFFAYALVAEIPGVAVDSDRRGLHVADWDLAMTPTKEGRPPTPRRRYWTLAAHPARYRVVDAVRDLDEDWWLTGSADLHAGDRVAIWKYKGTGDHRGIIAFGEVLTDPQMRDLSGEDHTYWMDPAGTAAALRVRVRYVIKPAEPLWLEFAPVGSVIGQLPVSRAQGGTVHHLTPDQWAQLMALAGGWPQPPADEHDRGAIWAAAEIQQAVTSYFTMLRAELQGEPYVKADANREVRAATGRSHGAVEYKFANISAVLRDIGLPYVLGYQPRGNYQSALRAEVERFLPATRRFHASSRKCPHLRSPHRGSSSRSIRLSWLRQAPAAAAGQP